MISKSIFSDLRTTFFGCLFNVSKLVDASVSTKSILKHCAFSELSLRSLNYCMGVKIITTWIKMTYYRHAILLFYYIFEF